MTDFAWRPRGVLFVLLAAALPGGLACQTDRVSDQAAHQVIRRHCIGCHSRENTERAFPIAPGGVVFDTPTDMRRFAERIRVRATLERTMPLLNKTGMTEEERGLLRRWVEHGARR